MGTKKKPHTRTGTRAQMALSHTRMGSLRDLVLTHTQVENAGGRSGLKTLQRAWIEVGRRSVFCGPSQTLRPSL